MVIVKCSVCKENVDFGEDFFEGDIAECDSCGSFLELQRDKKGEWTLVSIKGDWQEEEIEVIVSDKEILVEEEDWEEEEEEEEEDW